MIELVVSDIAGTCVQEHGAVYAALEEAVAATGTDVARDDVKRWMGADKREAVRALLGEQATPVNTVDATVEDFRRRLREKYRERPPAPMDGAEELFASLRERGVQVALTTGFDHEIADPLLASLGWTEGVVDAVVCASEVAAGRPAPFMIHRAMERCGVLRADRVLAVGDTALDLQAGTNAGIAAVVGVLSGGADAAVLGRVRHTHLLTSIAGLPLVLEELAG